MCLAVWHHDPTAERCLVLVANRDEFHHRPTAPLHWWDGPPLLAGRDLQGGGTWLGVDGAGRFAVLTNLRGYGAPAQPPSRGALIPDYLHGTQDAATYAAALGARADLYAGYNLILGDRQAVCVHSNRPSPATRALAAGFHGLGNGPYLPLWPKVQRAISALGHALARGADTEQLRDVLADRQPAADHLLPDTGLSLEAERRLSAAFVVGETYGTRSTTVVVLYRDGRGEVVETRYDADGQVAGQHREVLPRR